VTDLVVQTAAGLYCPAGDFHIDPIQPVARAVITHAHGDHARSGCGHYWTTVAGQPLLRERIGFGSGMTALRYGQAVEFGGCIVSLHAAGHILGSAQVRIECAGEVWVVSGDFKREPDPSCEAFEVIRCDTWITEATFARPEYCWPDTRATIQAVLDWWLRCKAEGRCAILFCYALGKAQRILAELPALTAETVYLHATMTKLVKLYRSAGVAMLPTDAIGNQPRFFNWAGRLVLAPPGAAGTPWVRRFAPFSKALASGWMLQDSARRRAYDAHFPLSDHADWPALLRTIDDCGAQRVLTMHGQDEVLLRWCRERGLAAAPVASR
jgi:putative mRNA 3-end processing factor